MCTPTSGSSPGTPTEAGGPSSDGGVSPQGVLPHSAPSYAPDHYSALFDGYPSKELADRSGAAPGILIIKGKYLVSQAASGLLVVNIRRAAERVAYERAVGALSRNSHVSQKALFPVAVQVGPAARLLFEEQAAALSALGFDIAPFGNDTVVVNGVPEGSSCEPGKVEQMVQDMVLILSDTPSGGLQDSVNANLAAKFATLESLGFSVSTPSEGQALLNDLFACENSELTPGGRRIVSIITTEELDKKF